MIHDNDNQADLGSLFINILKKDGIFTALDRTYRYFLNRYSQKKQKEKSIFPVKVAPVRIQKGNTKKIAIFTAIIGDYDQLKKPQFVAQDCDYICFSDSPRADTGVWQIRGIDYYNSDPTRTARYIKLHPHLYLSEYDTSIWVDANLLIKGDISAYTSRISAESKIATYIHPHRNCIYAEGRECIKRGLDNEETILRQLDRYKQDGYPEKNGLSETNIIVRKHNDPAVIRLMNAWWKEIENGSKRDQLSLNYVAYKQSVTIDHFADKGLSCRNDPLIFRFQHHEYPIKKRLFNRLRQPVYCIREQADPLAGTVTVDIAVHVQKDYHLLRLCLESLKGTVAPQHRIMFVADSVETAMISFIRRELRRLSVENCIVIKHKNMNGFSSFANIALKESNADYLILLHGETIVSQEWIEKIIRCGESSRDISMVGTVCNNDFIGSKGVVARRPGYLKGDTEAPIPYITDINKILEKKYQGIFPRLPVLNSTCIALKKTACSTIGLFNEKDYPQAFQDVADYCFRASDAGYSCAVSIDTYVYNYGNINTINESVKTMNDSVVIPLEKHYVRARVLNSIATILHNPYIHELYQDTDLNRNINRIVPALIRGDSALIFNNDASAIDIAANSKLMNEFKRKPALQLKRVAWFVPFFNNIHKGGIATIFRTAEALSIHENTENIFAFFAREKAPFDEMCQSIREKYPSLKFKVRRIIDDSDLNALPESDAGVCTLWTSAYLLLKYNRCRAKFYFIQDFEANFYTASAYYGLVEQTYRFGFIGISNTPGVGEHYRRYEKWVTSFIPAVDRSIFYPEKKKTRSTKRIVFYGRPNNERNGFELGIEALRKVKAYFKDDVEIISVGGKYSVDDYNLSGIIENYGELKTIDEVAVLYRSSDLGLVFMFTPHPSYQPFEYMASGCVTVTNDNMYNTWLLKDGYNAVLTIPTVSMISARIIEVLENKKLTGDIIKGGLETVSRLNWESQMKNIIKYMKKPTPRKLSFFKSL